MHADINGALAAIDKSWRTFIHRGKPMTKAQVLAVLSYAKKVGYDSTAELKDEEVDDIIDKVNRRT
ncbi:hypothetical protein [Flavobacterium sp. NRK1]|uniref:hypothetical protein n=1 Tax=Flavobacterium sp. NRK1 TaxID=2954929 RepID=UPI002091EC49|nr:hypothetical protein [Flavobacterium sp. NRK1]MCO6149073.1 hypothetical protein [Flavobacterium sp. NRK1]